MADNLSTVEFLKVYIPAAKAGKTAGEIAKLFGKEKANYVTTRASQLRKAVREEATKQAESQKLSNEATKTLVAEAVAQIPTLSARSHASVLDMLSTLNQPEETNGEAAEADSDAGDESETEQA